MTALIITIVLSLILCIIAVILAGKTAKTDKSKRTWIMIAALGTVFVHYSSLIYHGIGHAISPDKITSALTFLECNPNLVLPIYPCNVVMWLCVIFAFLPKKETKIYNFFVDFIFIFGAVSAFVGILANGDYFNPNVAKDYDICKSAVAHGFMLMNVLLLPVFGFFKVDTLKNVLNVTFGVLLMGLIGLVDDLIVLVIGGEEKMSSYNAMFLFRSPIEALPFCTFYIIGPVFIVLTLLALTIYERLNNPHLK